MSIDFEPIVKSLKKTGYSGYFTLEADRYLSAFDADNVSAGLKDLYDSVKKLADMFERF